MRQCGSGQEGAFPARFILLAPSDRQSGTDAPSRILVVEDDYFVALELEHQLTQAGFEVVAVAATAEDAKRLAAEAIAMVT